MTITKALDILEALYESEKLTANERAALDIIIDYAMEIEERVMRYDRNPS